MNQLGLFGILPVEIIEQILLYLSIIDIWSFFAALNNKYNILSIHFWKTLCEKHDFLQTCKSQEWYECFKHGFNKRHGHYVHVQDVPSSETLEHIYSNTFITSVNSNDEHFYNIYLLDEKNKISRVQQMKGYKALFKEEFIVLKSETNIQIYWYNKSVGKYDYYKSVPESIESIVGISDSLCISYNSKEKRFIMYLFYNDSMCTISMPSDVKFLIDKMYYKESIVISTLSFSEGYKIKVYDINSQSWTLDLVCFGSTGITNDPNMWVGSHFIGCCDVSYRLRGIYFGLFKVWNRRGTKIIEAEIEPSNKHYLRCYFKNETVLLTTSDSTIDIFNAFGERITNFKFGYTFIDLKLSTGYLLFVLHEDKALLQVYDWNSKHSSYLYSIQLKCCYNKSFFNDCLYCPISCKDNSFEIINFC